MTHDCSNNVGNFRITAYVPAGAHYPQLTGFGTPNYTLTLMDTMDFVRIPAETFVMGSPEDEDGRWEGREDQHLVRLSQASWMGSTR